MAIPISNVTRRVVFSPTGAGGAGPYAFTFEILAAGDIAVYKDDVLLTLTTHYTVTINTNGTGSVTITAAGLALSPVSPTQYAIVGNRTIARSTDFTTGGDFFANTLNDELDQQTIFAQQNAEGLARALQAPQTDPTTIDMTLPRASERAGKYLAFDEDGNPQPGDTAVEVAEVAVIKDDIVAVSAIDTDVTAVAAIDSDVTTVAGIAANVTTVAGIAANVTSVAGNASNINTVAADGTDIGAVAAISADVQTVADIAADVTAVAAADASDLAAVAAIGADVATVSGIAADVTTVAGISADVTAVADDGTDIGTVATNIANVNTVAGVSGNITTVAGIQANVTTVAGIAANVTTVAGIAANVTTVAGIAADVSSVAAIDSDIETVADNLADVTNFADVYIGPSASNPTTRNDASALVAGDLYFNTVASEMRVWTGSAWTAATSSPDTVVEVEFTATAGQTNYTFTGGYRVGFTYVWVNGVMLADADITASDGTTITFGTALALNDEVRIITFKSVGTVVISDVSGLQTALNSKLNSTDPQIIGTIIEDVYTITDGAAFEIDPGNGSIQLITLGASRTPKATNFASGEAVTLMVDDGSAFTLTWTDATFGGSGVVWKTDTGSAPALNTTGYTVIVLWKVSTQVYGARVGNA